MEGWFGLRGLVLPGILAAIPLASVQAADAPTGGDQRVRAFVFRNMYMASSGDAGSCPALTEGSLETFAKTLSPQEQAQYGTPDKQEELSKIMAERLGFKRLRNGRDYYTRQPMKVPPGYDRAAPLTPERALEVGAYNGFPKGRGRWAWRGAEVVYNSCSNPEDFPQLAKGYVPYAGKVAPGIDLDGKAGRSNFTGLDGSKGVDNQLWRAVGCVKSFRDDALPKVADETMNSSEAPTAVVIRDIDDIRNDPEVMVDFYAVSEPLTRDGRGHALSGATITPVADPRFHTTTRGRIVDGVLTTEPVDLTLQFREQVIDSPKMFRTARIRIVFTPDGGIEGSINGYETLDSFWQYMEQRTQASSEVSGYTCPGVKQAIDRFADGFRDPRTGRYTAISASYNFLGVHAFVVPPSQTAAAEVLR